MSQSKILLNFFVFSFVLLGASEAIKVPVTIYYESLCPDSAQFITEQVYPNVKSGLKDAVDIEFVPYGKSTYQTMGAETIFDCHHGPNECYGNKVHACAIEHIQSNSYQLDNTRESLILDFINCLMKIGNNFPSGVYPGARCAAENQISNWENIKHCANSTEGNELLKKQADITNKFQNPLERVPTVVFKGQYDARVSKDAIEKFAPILCKYVSEPQPKLCSQINASDSVAANSLMLYGLLTGLSIYVMTRRF